MYCATHGTVCPNCGYCRACGRGGWPLPYIPVYTLPPLPPKRPYIGDAIGQARQAIRC